MHAAWPLPAPTQASDSRTIEQRGFSVLSGLLNGVTSARDVLICGRVRDTLGHMRMTGF